jgi:GT2 family glycosyltransferase
VEPGWLEAMVEAAPHADVIGGRLDEETLNADVGAPARPRMVGDGLPVALGFLPFAVGANFAVWAGVLRELGGFDERFTCGYDDVELSFRAQLAGKHLRYAPDAVVAYRHRASGLDLFRQFRSYGRSEPLLYAEFRQYGMPRPAAGEVARRWARLVLGAPLASSPETRGKWLVNAGFSLGRLRGALTNRVPYL